MSAAPVAARMTASARVLAAETLAAAETLRARPPPNVRKPLECGGLPADVAKPLPPKT